MLEKQKLIYHAKKNGADAVKLQTYTPDMMTLKQINLKLKMVFGKIITMGSLKKLTYTMAQKHRLCKKKI